MTTTDHYLLHPVAWAVCQEVLEQEAAMIAGGQSAEQRSTFLVSELERITSTAEVTVSEAATELLSGWGLADLSVDISEIRRRFQTHGRNFKLRETRNSLRRLGLEDHTLVSPILGIALFAISGHDELTEPMRRLFEARINTLLTHPSVVQADSDYTKIMQRTDLLQSQREQQVIARARDVLTGMFKDVAASLSFAPSEYRDLARVRGAMLDLSLLDLMEAAAANGLLPELRQLLLASSSSGVEIYRRVAVDILSQRIRSLEVPAPSLPDAPLVEPDVDALTEPALLTVREVMKILGVSRMTLNRLAKSGVLLPLHIGRSVRYDPKTLDEYLARDRG